MFQKVNYILHLNKAFQKLTDDRRLSPHHVSLYYSLFQYWNIAKFKSPISISRDDQMQASKIGSANTYLRCLKDLHQWGYIRYQPSYNPMKGSLVYLFTFDTGTDTGGDTGTGIGSNTGTDTTPEQHLRPSINTLNKLNKQQTKINGHEKKQATHPDEDFDLQQRKIVKQQHPSNSKDHEGTGTKKEKLRQKKKVPFSLGEGRRDEVAASGFVRPLLPEVRQHFKKEAWPALEAEKFFNHYESVGWLVGGKTPMQNWQASAGNWMINAELFKVQVPPLKPGSVHVNNNKDYSEPL